MPPAGFEPTASGLGKLWSTFNKVLSAYVSFCFPCKSTVFRQRSISQKLFSTKSKRHLEALQWLYGSLLFAHQDSLGLGPQYAPEKTFEEGSNPTLLPKDFLRLACIELHIFTLRRVKRNHVDIF